MKKLASVAFTLCFLFSVINLSLIQLQGWLLGHIVFPEFVARIGLYLVALVCCWLFPQRRGPVWLWKYWAILVVALAVSFLVVRSEGELSLGDQLMYLMANYYSLLLLPICLFSKPFLNVGRLFNILTALFFPLCVLGIFQYLRSDPILPTSSGGGEFDLGDFIRFNGQVRAFSLFPNGLHFSYFIALVTGYAVAKLMAKGSRPATRLFFLGTIVLAAFATYCTVTRLAFLNVGFTALFAVAFTWRRSYSRTTWFSLPLLALCIGGTITLSSAFISMRADSDLYSDDSLLERFYHWAVALESWTGRGTERFLFGTGVSQGKSPDYIVDDTFLNFAVHGGLIGLIGSLVFMYALWMLLRHLIDDRAGPAVIAVCAFTATWLFTGLFNTTNAIYGLILTALFVAFQHRPPDHTTPPSSPILRSYPNACPVPESALSSEVLPRTA